jgi:hypothetical protein
MNLPRLAQKLKFQDKLGSLMTYGKFKGYNIRLAEVFRPGWVAVQYAKEKLGIVNSKHRYGIAADVWLLDDNGNEIFDIKPGDKNDLIFADLANYWENTLMEEAGYKWKKRDTFHFQLREAKV